MPLFKNGDYNQLTLSSSQFQHDVKTTHKDIVKFPKTLSLDALSEVSFNIDLPKMDLAKSSNKWGLYLKSLILNESFEGFIPNLFDPKNEIYFTSIAWDYSGSPLFMYPPKGIDASLSIIPMKGNKQRHIFAADGINIWPAQTVVGSLNLMIFVCENDEDIRDLGEQLVVIHDQISNSKLAELVNAISINPSLATGVAIGVAVNELIGIIGNIMKRNKNDYVDLFQGSYGTDKLQSPRIEKCDHESAGMELEFTVS